MNKKSIILISIITVVVLGLLLYVLTRPEPMIIQGEVDCQSVDISSKIPGRIEVIKVKKGDTVSPGDVLVKLDTPDIQAKAQQSNAALQLAQAENLKVNTGTRKEQIAMAYNDVKQAQAFADLSSKTYARLTNLHREGVIPAQKLDDCEAAYKKANSTLEAAKSNYNMLTTGARSEDKLAAGANVQRARGVVSEIQSYLSENTLKSPIKGEVTEISAEVGELVGTGYPIVTIVNLDDMWIVFNLREDLLEKVKMGTVIDARLPALGKEKYSFRVNHISVLGNFATWRATRAKGDFDMKTFEVKAVPVGKIDGLRAGMSAIVNWDDIK